MPTLNLGRIAIVPKGNWAAGTYKKLDSVRHNGAAWLCMAASTTTQEPSGTASDWMKLVEDGLDGGGATLGANTFTGNQTGGDNKLIQWTLQDVAMTYLDKGTVSTGTVTFSFADASHQRLQVGGALTIAVNGWSPTNNNATLMIELVNGASAAITWPTINWIKSDGTTTTSFASNGVTLQTSGTDFVVLWTRDGGTTIYGKVIR